MNTTDVIRALCAGKGISVTELEKELGFSNGSLTKNNYIRSDRLRILADYFNVSMEYLMTGETFFLDNPIAPPPEAIAWYERYKKASPEVQKAVELLLKADQ